MHIVRNDFHREIMATTLSETTNKLNIANELKKFTAMPKTELLKSLANEGVSLKTRDLQALYEVSKAVNSSLILDEILSLVMIKSIELLKAERGFLMLLDSEDKLQFKTAHNIKKQELDKTDMRISTTIAESVVKSGKSLYTSDAIKDSRFSKQQSVLQMNIRSAMCVPLKIKEQIIGVVYLDNSSKSNIFLKSDLYLFELFADLAAMAIQNAQLYTELFALQRFQEAILDKTPVGIMVLSENGNLKSYNNAAFAILFNMLIIDKNTDYDIIDSNFIDLLPAEDREFWKTNIDKSADKTIDIKTHRISTKSNTDVILSIRFSPFHHTDNSLSGRIIVLEDITDQVQMEQYLVISEKMVAKGEMAAAIGHELNNYLTTIMSSAQLLGKYVESGKNDKIQAKVEAIVDGIDRMKRFTSGLMDFSTLDTKKNMQNIHEIIEDVVFFIKPQQKFKKIKFEISSSIENPLINIDVGQIHQVILNLFINAADAIAEHNSAIGIIKIDIKRSGKHLDIVICDNGPGIPDNIMPMIFQPHFTSKKTGHGIGLSNSKRIIENHNGEISVANSNAGGAEFTIKLPMEL